MNLEIASALKSEFHPSRRRPQLAGACLAFAVALMALAAPFLPALAETLQWERESFAGGHAWLVVTGHLVHWSGDHLAWDLAAFVLLSMLSLQLIPQRYPLALGLSALLIPLEVFLLQPQLATYRGLSGVDSALFALFLCGLWTAAARHPRPRLRLMGRIAAAVGASLFLAKLVFELITGSTLFVTSGSTAGNFVAVPSAHLVGFVAGALAATPRLPRIRPIQPVSPPASSFSSSTGPGAL